MFEVTEIKNNNEDSDTTYICIQIILFKNYMWCEKGFWKLNELYELPPVFVEIRNFPNDSD